MDGLWLAQFFSCSRVQTKVHTSNCSLCKPKDFRGSRTKLCSEVWHWNPKAAASASLGKGLFPILCAMFLLLRHHVFQENCTSWVRPTSFLIGFQMLPIIVSNVGQIDTKLDGRSNPPRGWGTGWSESRKVPLFRFCDTPCIQAEWTWCYWGRKCQCHCGSLAFETCLDAAGGVLGFGKRNTWNKSWFSSDLFCWRRVSVWLLCSVAVLLLNQHHWTGILSDLRGTAEGHSQVLGVSKWIKVQSWPSGALASTASVPACSVLWPALGSLKPATASILRALNCKTGPLTYG